MSKLFVLFCTFLAIFISVSGFAGAQNLNDFMPHLFFVPVTIYLVSSSIWIIFHPKESEPFSQNQKKAGFIISLILFISLLTIGIRTINSRSIPKKTDTAPAPAEIIFQTPTPTTAPLLVTVRDTNPELLVNIRSQPSAASKLITKVQVGKTFPLMQVKGIWIEISLDSTSSGWISSNYATISGQITR